MISSSKRKLTGETLHPVTNHGSCRVIVCLVELAAVCLYSISLRGSEQEYRRNEGQNLLLGFCFHSWRLGTSLFYIQQPSLDTQVGSVKLHGCAIWPLTSPQSVSPRLGPTGQSASKTRFLPAHKCGYLCSLLLNGTKKKKKNHTTKTIHYMTSAGPVQLKGHEDEWVQLDICLIMKKPDEFNLRFSHLD